MKKITMTLLALLTTSLIACSDKPKEEAKPLPAPPPPQQEKVGPYDVQFTDYNYEHKFNIQINQSEGKVDYNITTQNKESIRLENTYTLLTGCDVNQVQHDIFWIPDNDYPTQGIRLYQNTLFNTIPGKTGKVIHSFHNIGACTQIEVYTKFRLIPKETHINKPCQGYSDINECKVEVYCKESYDKNFHEVEVWKFRNALQVNNYMNFSNSPRALQGSTTANMATNGVTRIYQNTNGYPMNLNINLETGDAVYTDNIANFESRYSLKCEL